MPDEVEQFDTEQEELPQDGGPTEQSLPGEPNVRFTAETGVRAVVALGASAGGLEALQQVFASMPHRTGMAFVVAQHLSPDFKSLMPELLGRQTPMVVASADHDQVLEPDHVYVLSAGKSITVDGNMVRVQPRPAQGLANMPINLLFESLASLGELAVAVILSGTGQDGTVGAQMVRSAGGLVIAQDPASARFDSMPRGAIDSGCVDIVVPPSELGSALVAWLADPVQGRQYKTRESALPDDEYSGPYAPILAQLRTAFDLDFNQYKPTTILRRIERRLNSQGQLQSPDALAQKMMENPTELNTMFSDLLIGVTRFFRDTKAFDEVNNKAIVPLVNDLGPTEEMRIWCCGCSTGEEAYSLAILALEAFEARGLPPRLRVLATDVHPRSVQIGSAGLYQPEALEAVPKDFRDKYFVEQPTGLFKVTEQLRKYVVFSVHNAFRDAAFPRISLVSCRNMLIYLQSHAQSQVLSSFHFSLKSDGYLFLGEAETPGELTGAFEAVEGDAQIYQKVAGLRLPIPFRPVGGAMGITHSAISPVLDRHGTSRLYEVLTQKFMPSGILVNQMDDIVHIFGDAGRWLQPGSGRFVGNVTQMLRGSLRMSVMMALRQAAQDRAVVELGELALESADGPIQVRIKVEPVFDRALPYGYFLVVVSEAGLPDRALYSDPAAAVDVTAHQLYADLEAELLRTREALQRTIEDLESANEELQAGNEELMAANEELQSTNEELHAVNEELYTVNSEYELKIKELHETSADLNNLILATELPIVFLDEDARVRLFTPAATSLFPLRPGDVGRELRNFASVANEDRLLEDIELVSRTGMVREHELEIASGRTVRRRLTPYRNSQNQLLGSVLTYIDITEQELARAARAVADANSSIRRVVNAVPAGVFATDAHFGFQFVSERLAATDTGSVDHLLGDGWLELVHPDDLRRVRAELNRRVERRQPVDLEFRWKSGNEFRWHRLRAAMESEGAEPTTAWYGVVEDRHDAIVARRELENHEHFLEDLADGLTVSVAHFDNDGLCSFANSAARQLFGRPLTGVELSDAMSSLGIAFDEECVHCIETVRSGSRSSKLFEATNISGRTTRAFRAEGVPHFDAEGAQIGFFLLLTDLTQETVMSNALLLMLQASTSSQLIVGFDGKIALANPAATALLGYTSEELTGMQVERLVPPGLRARHVTFRRGYSVNPTRMSMNTTGNLQVVRSGGELMDVDIEMVPTWWDGAQAVLLTLGSRHSGLFELSRYREGNSAFLAQLGHELRTPLTAITGLAELLGIEVKGEKQRDRIEMISSASEHMLHLIDDIIELTRLETSGLSLDLAPFDLRSLLNGTVGMVQEQAARKSLTIETTIDASLPARLVGDRRRIEQILLNYLSNAVKYTSDGKVTISATFMPAAENQGVLRVDVTDEGPGISAADQPRLFKPFSTLVNRKSGSSGLGLAISKGLANAMSGEVGVLRAPGGGAQFWVTLPLSVADERDSVEAIPLRGERDLAAAELASVSDGLNVLLVEDDPVNRMVIAELLRSTTQMVVTAVGTGEAALEVLSERGHGIDLVLVDLQLPGIDGFEVVRALRAQNSTKTLPVVALTSNVLPEVVNACANVGMNGHLGKPVKLRELTQVLKRLFSGERPQSPSQN